MAAKTLIVVITKTNSTHPLEVEISLARVPLSLPLRLSGQPVRLLCIHKSRCFAVLALLAVQGVRPGLLLLVPPLYSILPHLRRDTRQPRDRVRVGRRGKLGNQSSIASARLHYITFFKKSVQTEVMVIGCLDCGDI